MRPDLFAINQPRPDVPLQPILVSIPHSGTHFPNELKKLYKPEILKYPEDTDWHLSQIYSFLPSLGITTVVAHYSRYVVDLNRPYKGGQLYDDGRKETTVVPTISFSQSSLFVDMPNPALLQVPQRIKRYHRPYHRIINHLLGSLRKKFGQCLLFDAHSIRRLVPSIQNHPFPDLIIGDQNGRTCHAQIAKVMQDYLYESSFDVSYNTPFQGGFITRNFGQPGQGFHAIQLEMSQDIYMDENTGVIKQHESNVLSQLLQDLFLKLIPAVRGLN